MKVLIATGGTGGHIYPAVSLAKGLEVEFSSCELLFIGSNKRMESELIPGLGYSFYGLEVNGVSGNLLNKIKAACQLVIGYFKSKKLMKEFQPDVVVGFGNYISVPVLLAAKRSGIKTMIHEQNSVVGKANLFLSKHVDAIVGCYQENKDEFKSDKVKILGNPRASEAVDLQVNSDSLASLGLSKDKLTVLFVMGSLGSTSINTVLKKTVPLFKDKEYQVIMVAGKQGYDAFVSELDIPKNVKIVPYIDGIAIMKQVDLIVARGGATTAAEIAVLGLPSIIIPSPYVPHDHQTKNAMALQNVGAGVMISEKEADGKRLVQEVEAILLQEEKMKKMHEAAIEIGMPNAREEIIQWIKELVYGKNK